MKRLLAAATMVAIGCSSALAAGPEQPKTKTRAAAIPVVDLGPAVNYRGDVARSEAVTPAGAPVTITPPATSPASSIPIASASADGDKAKVASNSKARKRKAKRTKRAKPVKAKPEVEVAQPPTARPKPAPERSDEQWWREDAAPRVAALKDCIVAEVRRNAGFEPGNPTPGELIASAIDQECRKPFESMAMEISGRLGRDGFEPVAKELIDTIFVPAVRAALTPATSPEAVARPQRGDLLVTSPVPQAAAELQP